MCGLCSCVLPKNFYIHCKVAEISSSGFFYMDVHLFQLSTENILPPFSRLSIFIENQVTL